MKKVLFVATVTSHILGFHIPYLKWFKEQGYEVHVASNGDVPIEFCDKHYNLPFERFPFKKNNIVTYKKLKKIINENKYEIIHCQTPVGGVLARLAARKARKNGTKVMYTAHGFHFFKGASIKNWLIYYPVEKIMAHYTDCLITINKEDYEFAKKHLKAKRIELVHGVGVDKEKFKIKMTEKEKTELRKNLGIKKDDFVIIYPAELSKRKNQGMLLKSIALLKKQGYNNIKVLLPGKDSMNGLYKQMSKDLDIEKEIMFLGYRKDIPKLLKIANIAVSTSRQEGLPVNIMEAMMSEKPIVATNCRGNADLIENCVEIDDVEEFTKRIEEKIKMKTNKEKYNMEEYELDKILKQMKEIYNGDIQ